MMSKSWFHYQPDGKHGYSLGCEFSVRNRRIYLVSADLYKIDGEYVGNWLRENMPMPLVREIEKWLKGDGAAIDVLNRARHSPRTFR